jgi:DNA-binding transcriptional regulator YiaG
MRRGFNLRHMRRHGSAPSFPAMPDQRLPATPPAAAPEQPQAMPETRAPETPQAAAPIAGKAPVAAPAAITALQIRAARRALRLSAAEFAKRAGVSAITINRIESERTTAGAGGREETREHRLHARGKVLAKITAALSDAGAEFLPDNGLRVR